MIVVKFGGSSLASAERMYAAARIVAQRAQSEPVVCIVSAMAGVTDRLLTIARLAADTAAAWQPLYEDLRAGHEETLTALTVAADNGRPASLDSLWTALEADAARLASVCSETARDEGMAVFSAWGERLSVRLFAAALSHVGLEAACFEDAPVIVEREACMGTRLWAASVTATSAWLRDPICHLLQRSQTPILPGYLALRQNGDYTTLGRNGSDHSAAVVAAALDASAVYLYSDVAGIYRADPRIAPEASLLPSLSYEAAAAIAAMGARVLHPASLPPLAESGIPLYLRSAMDPDGPGTDVGLIRSEPASPLSPAHLALVASLVPAGSVRKVGHPDAF
jgi:bifunctional aspartokinase / homoserine dehydrogenase 1